MRTQKTVRLSLGACSLIFAVLLGFGGCSGSDGTRETWGDELQLQTLEPITVLPGSTLVVRGEGFVSQVLGTTRLRITGSFIGSGSARHVDAVLLTEMVSDTELHVPLPPAMYAQLCPEDTGDLGGNATVEVASLGSGKIYQTNSVGVGLHCRPTLEPFLVGIDDGAYHLNAVITILADDLLLGGDEGQTVLHADGCYLRDGDPAPCATNGTVFQGIQIPLAVVDPVIRRDGAFVLSPDLVGVRPGTLDATIRLVNEHANEIETTSAEADFTVTVLPLQLDSVEEAGASLGGFVDFLGAGFVGGGEAETTEMDLVGSFTPDGGGAAVPLDLTLIATFDSGERARYILDEQDSLGQLVDLRQQSGTVSGTFTPRIVKGRDEFIGAPVTSSFRIDPVHQVVYLNFTQGYKDALELFGLRAAEEQIRARIVAKARWIYRSLGVTFTEEVPDDHIWYAQVDLTGIDPNGLGLMGYDNSPGKDVGNVRLYDRIGGVNALTQEDGYPGYGGVFIESFLAFSEHPPEGVSTIPGSVPEFDEIFDHFRPDGGKPVFADELAGLDGLTDGSICPAGNRLERIQCAVFVLGNLIGTTMAHELGHSLGLSDPGGQLFHNASDSPNRLMDSGASRPFLERGELLGGGPEIFCLQNYDYLKQILPTSEPDPEPSRPSCY